MKLSLLYLNLLHASSDGFSSALILLLPFITTDLKLSLTEVGFLGGTFTLLTIILALPAGSLSVKFGGMRVLTATILAYAFGYIFMGFAMSFAVLFPIFLLSAAGYAVFNPIGYGLIARFSKKETRGSIIGTFSAFGDIGKLILTVGLTFIVATIGWRSTSFLYGGLALVFFLFLVASHLKNKAIHEKQEKPEHLTLKTLIQNKRFVLSCTSGIIDYMSSYPLFVFLPFVLLQKGAPGMFLGSFFGIYFIGNLLGKTFLGRMTDKYGHTKTFIAAELCTAIAITCLVVSNNMVFILFLTLCLGMLGKGTAPVTQTMVTESAEHHKNFEKSIAFYSLLGNVAAMVGTVSLGTLSDHFGVTTAFTLTAILALIAILPAMALSLTKNEK